MWNQSLSNTAMTVAAVLSFLIAGDVPAHAAAPLSNVHVRGTIATSRAAVTLELAAGIIVVGAPGITPPM
jgi:hypothetical protein